MPYVLITGGSKGIGKAIALEMAARNFGILMVARNEHALEQTATEIRSSYKVDVQWLSLDLSTKDAAATIFEWCISNNYEVQVLVNNAGYGLAGSFDSYPIQEHINMLQVNISSLISLTHQFIPYFKKQEKAYILNISSSAAYQATPGLALYSASKSLVLNFSRSLSIELGNSGISVTCVCPGGTDTDFPVRAGVGEKGLKLAEKVNMTPAKVASIAINGMFNKRTEVVTGWINKLGVFLAWVLPKKLVEKSAAKIYGV